MILLSFGNLLIDIVNVVVTARDREIRQTQPGGYPGTPLELCLFASELFPNPQ
jgi:hypothetical protein